MSDIIYRTRQKGNLLLILLAVGMVCLIVMGVVLTRYEEEQSLLIALLIMSLPLVVMLMAIVTFSSLTIELTREDVRFILGPDVWKRSFKIADIESCEPVKNLWWYGWGIRLHPKFTLYNVSGLKAIELSFKGRKRKVRIGCADPEEVCHALAPLLRARNAS